MPWNRLHPAALLGLYWLLLVAPFSVAVNPYILPIDEEGRSYIPLDQRGLPLLPFDADGKPFRARKEDSPLLSLRPSRQLSIANERQRDTRSGILQTATALSPVPNESSVKLE